MITSQTKQPKKKGTPKKKKIGQILIQNLIHNWQHQLFLNEKDNSSLVKKRVMHSVLVET